MVLRLTTASGKMMIGMMVAVMQICEKAKQQRSLIVLNRGV